ncbi:latent-transforming growth factor beta-binding protein 2-like [Bufo gargarizans]|uniref:latent-transforming growth factor beta-binding protein 2-like n=1 Tax=Bufo gargarizans TaxID=30331 RepID=UPI001CF5CC0D|nr:latent-transforming growth factor beta-binding protein 2-like [Bufo gargarizans]
MILHFQNGSSDPLIPSDRMRSFRAAFLLLLLLLSYVHSDSLATPQDKIPLDSTIKVEALTGSHRPEGAELGSAGPLTHHGIQEQVIRSTSQPSTRERGSLRTTGADITTDGSTDGRPISGDLSRSRPGHNPHHPPGDVDECAALVPPCGRYANCTNTTGSFVCHCHRGFLKGPSGCEDVDECHVAEITGLQACPPHSTCHNTIGSFSCSCDEGFVFGLDGKHCVDIDECAFENRCRRELGNLCVNNDGSYRCSCQAGFQESGLSCIDVDECKENSNICSGIGVCENVVGSYRCGCQAGFRGNGTYCEDENECASGRHGCDTNAHCGNVIGSYFCQCYQGFNGDGYSCYDIDECSLDNGSCEQLCVNQVGSFQCQCHQGYHLLPNEKNCTDIDECQTENGNCKQMCRNTEGSYQCLCRKGFQLHVDLRQCVDIDECKIDSGGCSHSCNNTEGGFICLCPPHQALARDQRTCINITSCGVNNGGCEQRCSDRLEGGFECSCRAGYKLSGDGRTCDDVDECADFTRGGCQQTCQNFRAPITAAATRGSAPALTTTPSASLCVTHPARTMVCVWPPTHVTALQAILDLAVQQRAPRLVPMEEPACDTTCAPAHQDGRHPAARQRWVNCSVLMVAAAWPPIPASVHPGTAENNV